MSFRTPAYRLHKPSGQAVVTINGTDFYLGPHGSDESKAEYDRLIGEWLAAGRRLPVAKADLTVNEVLLAYMRFRGRLLPRVCKQEYPTSPGSSLRPVKERITATPRRRTSDRWPSRQCANQWWKPICAETRSTSGSAISSVRSSGLSKTNWPRRQCFKRSRPCPAYGAAESEARESAPIKPVPDAFIDADPWEGSPAGLGDGRIATADGDASRRSGGHAGLRLEHVGQRLDLRTGPAQDGSSRPSTDHLHRPKGARRSPPVAQDGLESLSVQPPRRSRGASSVQAEAASHTQSPDLRDALEEKSAERRPTFASRTVHCRSLWPGHCSRYQTSEPREKEQNAEAAEIPHWHPHQLRHNAATWIRREFGLDVARVILGHRSPVVTEIYAEIDFNKAVDVIARVG